MHSENSKVILESLFGNDPSKAKNIDPVALLGVLLNSGRLASPHPESPASDSSFTHLSPDPTDLSQVESPAVPVMEAPTAKPKDDEFYYDCRTFLVENHLFRLPIHHLAAQSSYFQNLADTTKDGLTEDKPIDLDGISRKDFRQLLRVLCPPRTFQAEPEPLSLLQWESALKLAKKWEMEQVKTHAISAIEKLPNVDPVDKIILARTYDVRPWLAPSFNEILQRSKSLTESDVERLGVPTAVRLMGLRDRLRPSGLGAPWVLGSERLATVIDFKPLICEAFPDSKGEEKCEARSVPAESLISPTIEDLLVEPPDPEDPPPESAFFGSMENSKYSKKYRKNRF